MKTINLKLDENRASSLYLLLDTAIDILKHKKSILLETKLLEIKDRPEELKDNEELQELIRLNGYLIINGINIIQEIGDLIKELNIAEHGTFPNS